MRTDFLGLFTTLNSARVPYVVVGGLALLLHGVDRVTADVDLVTDLATGATRDLISALTAAGYRPVAPVDPELLADAAIRDQWRADCYAGRRAGHRCVRRASHYDEGAHGQAARPRRCPATARAAEQRTEMTEFDARSIPEAWGSFEDAEKLRRWAFLQKSPAERLAWMIEMLEIAYATGARQLSPPPDDGD